MKNEYMADAVEWVIGSIDETVDLWDSDIDFYLFGDKDRARKFNEHSPTSKIYLASLWRCEQCTSNPLRSKRTKN